MSAREIPTKKPARASKPKTTKKKAKKGPVKLDCGKCTHTFAKGFIWRCEFHKTQMRELAAERKRKNAIPFELAPGRAELERAARERAEAISNLVDPPGWIRLGITTKGMLYSRRKGKRRIFKTVAL